MENSELYKELVADIKALVEQWHYRKDQTYTQTEILNLITQAIANLKLVDVVTELPTTNIKNNQLYLVVNRKNIENNKFDIYLYANNDWEQIDKLEFDIANYYNKSEVDTLLATKSDVGHRHDNSSINNDGFMSKEDKSKLNGVEAEANKTLVDSTLSSSSTNPVENKVVKSALDTKVDKITGKSLSTNDFTTEEKNKLAGIATGANKTIVDSSLSDSSANPVENKVVKSALDSKAGLDTATTSAKGLMSSSDKTKLDGIATGANKTIVDSSLSTTSTNPVQNNIINNALNNKVDKVSGKGLSTNDFTTDEKNKLAGIATGATKNTVSNSLQDTSTTNALSAAKGKELNEKFNNYATTESIDNIVAGNVDLTGYVKTNDSRLTNARTPTAHNQASTTITESSALGNLGTSANANQHTINDAVNTKIGLLSSIKALQVVDTKPTASADTMNKLYIVSENNKINFYYTRQSGSTYSWSKMDIDILDELSIAWGDITGKPTSFTPSSHGHGSIGNAGTINSDITSVNKVAVTDSSNNLKTIAKVPFANLNISKNDITGLGIPASDTNTTYGAGTGLSLSNNNFSVNYGNGNNNACVGNDSRLSDSRVPKFTQITASSSSIIDLRTYKTGGFYYCSADAQAQYITYCPNSNGTSTPYTGNKSFFLLVETWGTTSTYVKHTLTYYNDNKTYTRTCSNGTWGSWVELSRDTNTTYSNATTSANGLMSSTDKTKLDGIANSANNYSHPSTHAATMITDATAHSNIGSAANANQGTINTAIDTALSNKQAKGNYAASSHAHSYLPLSGGTLTGAVAHPQLRINNVDNLPYSGAITYNTDWLTTVKERKSLIGTLSDGSTWWNVLSIRHRNGSGDGTSWGMYIKSKLTGNGDLIWQQDLNGTATSEKTILDSSNYSTYANKTTVENVLTSDSTTNALSAAQGKALKTAVDGKAASGHNHDGTYLKTVPAHTNNTAANIGAATTSTYGHTKLNSATNSNDETTAATPKAVKAAYDKGNHSHPYAASSHTHSTWTDLKFYSSTNVELNLYANEAIRMCELYVSAFLTLNANTAFTVGASGWIPSGYRPAHWALGIGSFQTLYYVDASGGVTVRTAHQAISSSGQIYGQVSWNY